MAACKSEPASTTHSTTTGTTGTTEAPPTEAETFVPTGEYTIVYSEVDGSSTALSQAVTYLSSAMSTVYGIYPDRGDDYYRPAQGLIPGEYEILVGATNRSQSQAAFADLGVNDYVYYTESENVIVICGGSVSATVEAVEEFCKHVLGYVDNVESENQKTPITIGEKIYYRDGYADGTVTLNGAPLSEWTISVGATTGAADLADAIVTKLGAVTGERIRTVLRRNLTGEEKNLIVIGANGREHTSIGSFSGCSYRYEADKVGAVLSLVAQKNYVERLADHLFQSMTKSSLNGATDYTLSQEEYVYYAVEDKIDPWILVSETSTTLYDGVVYLEQVYRDDQNRPYRTYALLIDPDKVDFITGTSNDGYDYALDEADRQTTKQHMQAAVANGESIIAGVNTNFFNIHGDYSPIGLVIKDGVQISPATGYGFFGVTEDGKPIIDSGSNYQNYVKNGTKLVHAVSGADILVTNGDLTAKATTDSLAPRSLIGMTEDGTVIIGVIDGRQAAISNGASFARCALWMKSLGATTVLNLDGGGSTNLILRNPSTDSYTVCNSPSDGSLRKIHTSLLIALKED